jgi:hypothetical protein
MWRLKPRIGRVIHDGQFPEFALCAWKQLRRLGLTFLLPDHAS